MYGLYSPDHKWYYLHHQTPEEILLFKIFDSDLDVPAKCKHKVCIQIEFSVVKQIIKHQLAGSLHVAINYNKIPSDALPRESLELRYLVVSFP